MSVRKEQIRVLFVQSYPNFEFRYLKEMLHRDSTIELKTVLQEADLQYAETDKTALRVFPERKEDLFEYDVILFGDVDPAFLEQYGHAEHRGLRHRKGRWPGARRRPAVHAAGLPRFAAGESDSHRFQRRWRARHQRIDHRRFSGRPDRVGRCHAPVAIGRHDRRNGRDLAQLPPLYWMFDAPTLKPAARVLAESSSRAGHKLPVICLQYVGAGKVLFHATDETWRWRYRVGDVFFARYWVQTLRYLSRSKLLGKDRSAELAADRREYRRGESVRLWVRFLDDRKAPEQDDGVTVIIEQEGQQNRRVQLHRNPASRGMFEGLLSKPPVGKYHAWIATPALEGGGTPIDFRVVPAPGEFERVQMELAELKRAAELTKGRWYTTIDTSKLLSDLPPGQPVPIETLPPIVLWNQWPLLMIFLTLIVGEWVIRKRKGML